MQGCTLDGLDTPVTVLDSASPDLGGGGSSSGGNLLVGTTLCLDNQGNGAISAQGNWWGCESTAEMESGLDDITLISDAHDGPFGEVDFSGWIPDYEPCPLYCTGIIADEDPTCEGNLTTFTGRRLGGEGLVSWAWDLDDDGLYYDDDGNPIQKAYGPGTKPISVQVTDDLGSCISDSSIIVQPEGAFKFRGLDAVGQVVQPGYGALRLEWEEPTEVCGGAAESPPVYNIYRETVSGFIPGSGNLLATCVTDTFYVDREVSPGMTYYYVTRAESPGTHTGPEPWVGPCNEGTSDINTVERSGTAAAGSGSAPDDVGFLTVTSVNGQNTLEWVNPAADYGTTRVCWRQDRLPEDPGDGTCFDQSGTAGTADSYQHNGLTNASWYHYGVWVESSGGGVWSAGRFNSGRPFDTSGPAKWAYSTGATTMAPPGIGSVFATSNDRGLHSMAEGELGGTWPAQWTPFVMNAPAQARPPVIPLAVAGTDKVVFVGSQDGNVYAVDADTGALLWDTETANGDPLGRIVQAGVAAMFSAWGAPRDLLFVGTRDWGQPNSMFALDPDTGVIVWEFVNALAQNGVGGPMGIVSSQAAASYASDRVCFATREGFSGNPNTVYCLDAATGDRLWSAAVGDVDGSPSPDGTDLFVGTNAGEVVALDTASPQRRQLRAAGDVRWTYATDDGPVKGFVWPDPVHEHLYLATTTTVWGLVDEGGSASLLFSEAIPSPSTPLVVADDALRYLLVGAGDGRLYQLDLSVDPTDPTVTSVGLGDGTAAIGSPSFDVTTGLVHVGSEAGVLYAVEVPLS